MMDASWRVFSPPEKWEGGGSQGSMLGLRLEPHAHSVSEAGGLRILGALGLYDPEQEADPL